MTVVDTNVLAYLCLPGEYTAAAEALLRQGADWAAPLLWRSEFRNILAGYMRRGNLRLDQALAIQREAEDMLSGAEHEMDFGAVLELMRDRECSAYDCEFVASANQLGVKFVTMDSKVLRAFPCVAVALTDWAPQ